MAEVDGWPGADAGTVIRCLSALLMARTEVIDAGVEIRRRAATNSIADISHSVADRCSATGRMDVRRLIRVS